MEAPLSPRTPLLYQEAQELAPTLVSVVSVYMCIYARGLSVCVCLCVCVGEETRILGRENSSITSGVSIPTHEGHGGTAAHEYSFIGKKMYMQYIEKKKKPRRKYSEMSAVVISSVGSKFFIL